MLLAGEAFESKVWLDHERGPGGAEPIREFVPSLPRKYQAEVRHRDIMAVDRVGIGVFLGPVGFETVDHVRNDLMAMKVEVNPPIT